MIKRLPERLDEVEQLNKKIKEKEKDKEHKFMFKFMKPGCEKQFKFNEQLMEVLCENLKLELKKHFRRGFQTRSGK